MGVEILISGFIVGILFGWILQRGRVCFNTAIRDPFIFRDFTIIKGILLALALSMISFSIMALTGIVTLAPKPLIWPNQILGGFLFGMGMVLAAACASGVTYKTGEGIMTAFVGLLGLAMGATTSVAGWLSGPRVDLETAYSAGGVTFGSLIGPGINEFLMLILGVLFTVIIVWKWLIPARNEWKASQGGYDLIRKNWPWWFFGIALVVLNSIAWPLSAMAGRNYPLGITAGWVDILRSFTDTTYTGFWWGNAGLNWLAAVVLGVILGSFFGAMGAKEYKMAAPRTGKPIFLAFVGGLMLGVGAVFGKGCNIGNLLSGVPQLSLGSWLFSGFLILGVWFMAFIIFKWRESDILE
jgi:hypothetical protein